MEAEAAALAALPLAAKVDDDTQEKPQREGFLPASSAAWCVPGKNIGSGFFGLFSGKKIDDDLFEELETQLLTADLGVDTTTRIIEGWYSTRIASSSRTPRRSTVCSNRTWARCWPRSSSPW
jgi:fused signal recognition particle receptor